MLFSVLLLIHCVLANKLSKGRWNEKLFTTKIFLVSFYIAFSSVYYSLPEEKIFYTLRYSKGGDRRGKWCGTMPLLCATFVILGAVWFNYRSMRMMYASAFWMQTHCVLGTRLSSQSLILLLCKKLHHQLWLPWVQNCPWLAVQSWKPLVVIRSTC